MGGNDQVVERAGPALAGRILVFDGGRLVGIVSPADISHFISVCCTRASPPGLT